MFPARETEPKEIFMQHIFISCILCIQTGIEERQPVLLAKKSLRISRKTKNRLHIMTISINRVSRVMKLT